MIITKRPFLFFTALVTIPLLTLVSCGKKDGGSSTITLKMKVAESPVALSLAARSIPEKDLLLTAAGNKSFAPEVFKLWINTIVLQNDDGTSNQFFTCDSSAADCEVDFASAASVAAFEAKLNAVKITTGTYNKVWISCNPNSAGYVKYKGHATVNGTAQYTADPDANGGSPLTTDVTKNAEIKVANVGCGLTMHLPQALTIADGDNVVMTMFSNTHGIAYYGPNLPGDMGGCKISSAASTGPGFCVGYPSVFPYFGETTPTVEMYKIANSKTDASTLAEGQANVLLKVIKGSDGKPFWASMANFYSETTPDYGQGDDGVSGYANSVTNFSINADESLTIKSMDYGFSAFRRTAHSGDVVGEGISAGAGTGSGVTYKYKAFTYTP